MKKIKSPYHGFRFPAAIISCAVRWHHRFNLSLSDIEKRLLERGVTVTYESVRNWCDRFGEQFARRAKAARGKASAMRFFKRIAIWHQRTAVGAAFYSGCQCILR